MTTSGIVSDTGMMYVVGERGLRLDGGLKNFGGTMQSRGLDLPNHVQLPTAISAVNLELKGVDFPILLNFR